jgi:hypothetical protein
MDVRADYRAEQTNLARYRLEQQADPNDHLGILGALETVATDPAAWRARSGLRSDLCPTPRQDCRSAFSPAVGGAAKAWAFPHFHSP